ncbi:hypothetical protein Tco_0127146 [Tanacetum coccineum]
MVVQNQAELGEGSANLTDPHHTPTITQPSTSQPQKTQKLRKPKRKNTQVPQPSGSSDMFANKVVHKELDDSFVSLMNFTFTVGGPRGNTLRSDEDRLKLNELMELCTTLQKKVLDLEKTKTTQANEIASLKREARVESFGDEEDLGEDASKQGRRINVIDADEDITLVNVQDDAEMFDVNVLNGVEVFVL